MLAPCPDSVTTALSNICYTFISCFSWSGTEHNLSHIAKYELLG